MNTDTPTTQEQLKAYEEHKRTELTSVRNMIKDLEEEKTKILDELNWSKIQQYELTKQQNA